MDSTTTAAETLDAIRTGAQHMVLATRGRMADVERSLAEGRFGEALYHLGELQGLIAPLAAAEQRIVPFHDTYLVRAADSEVGMRIKGMGTIAAREVDARPCAADPHHEHVMVTLHFEGVEEPATFDGNDQMLALNGPD